MSSVSYRPFDSSDFDTLAAILQELWHSDSGSSEAYRELEARDDLAHCLSVATFSQVALVDDVPSGIVLARSGTADPTWAAHWNDACRDLWSQMERIDPEALKRYREFIDASTRANEEMLGASDVDRDAEVVLLAVGAATRGLGAGSVLLDAATSYLASRGHRNAFLYTDTDCTWEFYEHRGLKRLGRHKATREERQLLPREQYLYGIDLSK